MCCVDGLRETKTTEMKKRALLDEQLIFERSSPGRVGYSLPEDDLPARELSHDVPADLCRGALDDFPEVSEGEIVRHFTRLSQWNLSAATTLYPLGSCTMKYNPIVNEAVARMPGFAGLHPLVPDAWAQGTLELMARLADFLSAVSGLPGISLQ